MACRYLLKYTQMAAGLFFFRKSKNRAGKLLWAEEGGVCLWKKVEVVDIGRLMEKEARINMENEQMRIRDIRFLMRMEVRYINRKRRMCHFWWKSAFRIWIFGRVRERIMGRLGSSPVLACLRFWKRRKEKALQLEGEGCRAEPDGSVWTAPVNLNNLWAGVVNSPEGAHTYDLWQGEKTDGFLGNIVLWYR